MDNKNSKTLLKASGLTKKFGSFVANDSINIEIKKGEIHALLGENGAGKSTLVKMFYGLLAPDEGNIKFNNVYFTCSLWKFIKSNSALAILTYFSAKNLRHQAIKCFLI